VYYEIINIKGEGIDHRLAHNFILETLLTGGILLFLLLVTLIFYLIYSAFKNSPKNRLSEINILIAIFMGLIISGIFLDSITIIWIWIVMALIISYNRENLLSINIQK